MKQTPNLILPKTIEAAPDADLRAILKQELEALDKALLPLQQGLQQSSAVGPSAFSVMILDLSLGDNEILARAGIFYTGVIAGCGCADDPTPVDELNEYCEVGITIDRQTAQVRITLTDTE